MARENAGHSIGSSCAMTKLDNAVAMLGFGEEAAALAGRGLDDAARDRARLTTAISIAARGLSCCRRSVNALDRGRRREVGFRDHEAVGEDHLLARFGRRCRAPFAVDGVDHGQHHIDMKFAAERAVGRKRLQDRRRIGEARGFDDDASERRHRAALAIEHQAAQRDLQIGAGDAADAAVAEQHGLFGAVAQQRIVDADRAELVDDHRRALPFRRTQKAADQRRLAGAEKSGDDRHRNPRAALAFQPPPERACVARGEEIEHVNRLAASWPGLSRPSRL